MQNKLLPCPFCGGEAEEKNINRIQNGGWGKSYFSYWCECKECHTKGKAFNTIDHSEPRTRARVFWNTRKPMERIVEHLEEQIEEQKGRSLNGNSYRDGLRKALDIVRKGGVDNAE